MSTGSLSAAVPRRPRVPTGAQKREIVEILIGMLRASGRETGREDAAEVLLRDFPDPHADGFAIAYDLKSRLEWDCDSVHVEIFDEFRELYEDRVRANQSEWSREHGIVPGAQVGDRIRYRDGLEGVVTMIEIPREPACFLVRPDGMDEADPYGHHCVGWEEAVAVLPPDAGRR